jgi:hypothetical protein
MNHNSELLKETGYLWAAVGVSVAVIAALVVL